MDAKKCDRCGKFYTGPSWDYGELYKKRIYRVESFKVLSKTGGLERGNKMDLCPECSEKLRKLMYNSEVKDERMG